MPLPLAAAPELLGDGSEPDLIDALFPAAVRLTRLAAVESAAAGSAAAEAPAALSAAVQGFEDSFMQRLCQKCTISSHIRQLAMPVADAPRLGLQQLGYSAC